MAVSFRVSFDDQASAAFRDAALRGRDLRPALRFMGEAGVEQTRKRFFSKRTPSGAPWKPSRKTGGDTLVKDGFLRDTIFAQPPAATSVEWGSNRVYAAIHQVGGTIRARNGGFLRFRVGGNGGFVYRRSVTIPARPYLGTNAANMAEFARIGLRHIAEPIGGAVSGGAT